MVWLQKGESIEEYAATKPSEISQPHLVATGKQLSPDKYFLIVDSYIISLCGNAVYALNALFCAH